MTLIFSKLEGEERVELVERNFIIKTSSINIDHSIDEKPIFLQMFIDTTQVRMLEESKAQFNYQRQRLANVSHEFRTPLNAMNMSLSLMKDSIHPENAKFHQIASSS